MYKGEVLGMEHSLEYILKTRGHEGNGTIEFNYRKRRNEIWKSDAPIKLNYLFFDKYTYLNEKNCTFCRLQEELPKRYKRHFLPSTLAECSLKVCWIFWGRKPKGLPNSSPFSILGKFVFCLEKITWKNGQRRKRAKKTLRRLKRRCHLPCKFKRSWKNILGLKPFTGSNRLMVGNILTDMLAD